MEKEERKNRLFEAPLVNLPQEKKPIFIENQAEPAKDFSLQAKPKMDPRPTNIKSTTILMKVREEELMRIEKRKELLEPVSPQSSSLPKLINLFKLPSRMTNRTDELNLKILQNETENMSKINPNKIIPPPKHKTENSRNLRNLSQLEKEKQFFAPG